MSNHTPGPWVIEHLKNGAFPRTCVFFQNNYRVVTIADLGNHNEAERLGNAYLIAAAPDMLDALEFVSAYLDEYLIPTGKLNQDIKGSNIIVTKVREAINKAKGSK